MHHAPRGPSSHILVNPSDPGDPTRGTHCQAVAVASDLKISGGPQLLEHFQLAANMALFTTQIALFTGGTCCHPGSAGLEHAFVGCGAAPGRCSGPVDCVLFGLDREHFTAGLERAVGQQAEEVLQPDASTIGGWIEVLRRLFQPAAFDGALVGGSTLDGDAEPIVAKFLHAGNPQCVGRYVHCNERHGRDARELRQRDGIVESGTTRGGATDSQARAAASRP